ncbi:hypothetical protein EZV62_002916 [Acer yangbiense]|uniref:Uncharacterized protein n=1 Tax=Acer yangbiense TaxID=1000413 RepID=A0A5C7IYH4_9ROSI|nr:hypothetical protein EZV62_002916 [Acer yangbiense]
MHFDGDQIFGSLRMSVLYMKEEDVFPETPAMPSLNSFGLVHKTEHGFSYKSKLSLSFFYAFRFSTVIEFLGRRDSENPRMSVFYLKEEDVFLKLLPCSEEKLSICNLEISLHFMEEVLEEADHVVERIGDGDRQSNGG